MVSDTWNLAEFWGCPRSKSEAVVVNKKSKGARASPSIAALEKDRFVVTWTNSIPSLGPYGHSDIQARIYSGNDAQEGDEFPGNLAIGDFAFSSCATALKSGGFVVLWTDLTLSPDDQNCYTLCAQIFSKAGTPKGSVIPVTTKHDHQQSISSITVLESGALAVSWTETAFLSKVSLPL